MHFKATRTLVPKEARTGLEGVFVTSQKCVAFLSAMLGKLHFICLNNPCLNIVLSEFHEPQIHLQLEKKVTCFLTQILANVIEIAELLTALHICNNVLFPLYLG